MCVLVSTRTNTISLIYATAKNFFATSHDKSACAGIRGIVKRLVTIGGLQRLIQDSILASAAMCDYCATNILGIVSFTSHLIRLLPAKGNSNCAVNWRSIKEGLQYHRFSSLLLTHPVFQTQWIDHPPDLVEIQDQCNVTSILIYTPPNVKEQYFVCCL